jgi:hypothetical protein
MRRLLVVVLALLSLNTRAEPISMATISSVLSIVRIAMNLGAGTQEFFEVRVQCVGRSDSDVLDQCFRLAVHQSIGSVVATQTSAVNGRLAQDEIINYSSGYVSKYEITQRQSTADGVVMRMTVWVAESRIARRLLGESSNSAQFNGANASAAVLTYNDSRNQSDRLLNSVLNDYPRRAFRVEVIRNQLEVDANRRSQLYVEYRISWDPQYLRSLGETLQAVQTKGENRVIINHAYFDTDRAGLDNPSFRIMMQQLWAKDLSLKIELRNENGQVINRGQNCMEFAKGHLEIMNGIIIKGKWTQNLYTRIPIGMERVGLLNGVNRVEILAVPSTECQNNL